ncbi:MAG TPA: hypothetical protein VMV52_06715 [Candidatus Nanopelagicaceae bacterium]|nr:hypothetical protein [Candidatus Nanopelagicaceae bacterium]
MSEIALFVAVFLACAVEAVEATTIVLAAGTARDWRSAFSGLFAGLVVLGAVISIAGPAISRLPFSILRIFVGGLLLVFGLQWLRKAILRASGFKAIHNEDLIFQTELAEAKAARSVSRTGVADWYAFTLAFKGVVLEGLEVAFIVLTFGTIQHRVGLATIAALTAVVVVALVAIAVHKPLARVPENNMKFVVGILLTSFGTFWGAEGAGAKWPGSDAALLGLIPFVTALSFLLVFGLRRIRIREGKVRPLPLAQAQIAVSPLVVKKFESAVVEPDKSARGTVIESISAFGAFWYDFVIGDDWRMAVGIVAAFGLTDLLRSDHGVNWIFVPVIVATLLTYSLYRAIEPTKLQPVAE